jgi:hypothetical protein
MALGSLGEEGGLKDKIQRTGKVVLLWSTSDKDTRLPKD